MEASNLIGYEGCFATRLRELMKKAKVTQQDLAAAVGTTRQAISQYADGSVQPNIEKLYKIAEFFHVSADYLLGMSSVVSSDIDIKAINKMLGLSEKTIIKLKALLDAIRSCAREGTLEVNNIEDVDECMQKWSESMPMPPALLLNLLLDGPSEHGYDVVEALGNVFMHKHDRDPDAIFVLSKATIDGDKEEIKHDLIDNTELLSDADIIAVRLLKLQQAVALYKKELDEQNSNGDK